MVMFHRYVTLPEGIIEHIGISLHMSQATQFANELVLYMLYVLTFFSAKPPLLWGELTRICGVILGGFFGKPTMKMLMFIRKNDKNLAESIDKICWMFSGRKPMYSSCRGPFQQQKDRYYLVGGLEHFSIYWE